MSGWAKGVVKTLVPDRWRRWVRRRWGWRWMRGDYPDWPTAIAAAAASGGGARLDRVVTAARASRDGKAAWDRDGVTFPEPEVHERLLDALRQAANTNDGQLVVLDFGGGLGSTWRQHRHALRDFTVDWRIVELPAVVAVGRREFATAGLSFFDSLSDAMAAGTVRLALLSSVLQYLEHPAALLSTLAATRIDDLVIDRVALNPDGREKLVVQHTPPALGGGASPCWHFARETLFAPLAEYHLEAEWPVPFDEVDGTVAYRGFWWRRRAGEANKRRAS